MTQQLTVELSEREMWQVQAAAQAKHLDPKHMTAQQLVEVLGEVEGAALASQAALASEVAMLGVSSNLLNAGVRAGGGRVFSGATARNVRIAKTDGLVGIVAGVVNAAMASALAGLNTGVKTYSQRRMSVAKTRSRVAKKQSIREIMRVAQFVANQPVVVQLTEAKPQLTAEQRRAARLEAAMSVNGMWKGKADKPQDGLAYQLEARAEWP